MTQQNSISSLGPFTYCPLCASALVVTDQEDYPRRHCIRCDRIFYHNPAPAAGGMIVQDDRILLVRRKFPPRVGAWTVPAGFLEYFESPAECAVREVHEETGLQTRVSGLFGVYAGNDDPRHTAVLILYHMDLLGGTLVPGDDASEAAFFKASNLPPDIAFRAHRQALADFFGRDREPGTNHPSSPADPTSEEPRLKP
jgi:8-oxo-dGTP diphosphatase